jgi:hypothetical protein
MLRGPYHVSPDNTGRSPVIGTLAPNHKRQRLGELPGYMLKPKHVSTAEQCAKHVISVGQES